MARPKRRFEVRCNYALKKGSSRWYAFDRVENATTGGYWRTKELAQSVADEMEKEADPKYKRRKLNNSYFK